MSVNSAIVKLSWIVGRKGYRQPTNQATSHPPNTATQQTHPAMALQIFESAPNAEYSYRGEYLATTAARPPPLLLHGGPLTSMYLRFT